MIGRGVVYVNNVIYIILYIYGVGDSVFLITSRTATNDSAKVFQKGCRFMMVNFRRKHMHDGP
jgi:hypothetical protein